MTLDYGLLKELGAPLLRMLAGLSAGLFLASYLESLGWTEKLAHLARPLASAAHLGNTGASAFALAFISPAAANALLSDKYNHGEINFRLLMLANLFNGLPAYFAHIPTIFLLLWPILGVAALAYAGVTLCAALLRTGFTLVLSRILLKPAPTTCEHAADTQKRGLREVSRSAWQKFSKRLPRLCLFTAPVYILMFTLQKCDLFLEMENWMASHLDWLSFLKPQAMGIIALQFLAEFGASLGAASAALIDGGLTASDIVVALLVGNVLATPLRAIRHQIPAYMGFFPPAVAFKLVLANQALRAGSMITVIAAYAAVAI